MTNPVFFEDPRTLTEARMIFVNHNLPGSLGGKSAQLYATQLRFAINEDVSIIATKDGFLVSDNPLMNDGWADIAAGLKVNVFKDVSTQTLLSVAPLMKLRSAHRVLCREMETVNFTCLHPAAQELWKTITSFPALAFVCLLIRTRKVQ
ncbi:MAG: hypothetical protein R3C17_19905 [Planctomycetaceae bacterium]